MRWEPAEERFWWYVRTGPGCWEWSGGVTSAGYGAFRLSRPRRQVQAHRFSWELHFGPIPAGVFVCHRCDNRLCVRADHLFLGTWRDNANDMVRKGRAPMAKLSMDQVAELRKYRLKYGVSYKRLGEMFGVAPMTAWRVANGARYH